MSMSLVTVDLNERPSMRAAAQEPTRGGPLAAPLLRITGGEPTPHASRVPGGH